MGKNFEYGSFALGFVVFSVFALFSSVGIATVVSANNSTSHLACISNTCTLVSGGGSDTCSPQGSSCGNQTHLACVNQACVAVAGGGSNLCTSNSQCQNSSNQTHLACISNTCTLVSGGGSNECSSSGAWCNNTGNQTHLACISNTCTLVSGPGVNMCSPQGSSCGNQTHLACVGFTCQTVAGAGQNTCDTSNDCFHLECNSVNRTCSKVLGSGQSTCATEGRACKPLKIYGVKEFIKLSPTAIAQLEVKCGSWFQRALFNRGICKRLAAGEEA